MDKCPQTFSFVCKKFYLELLAKEFSAQSAHAAASSVYGLERRTADQVVQDLQLRAGRVGASVSERDLFVALMCIVPKFHKIPVGVRFICTASHCPTRCASIVMSDVFRLFFQ